MRDHQTNLFVYLNLARDRKKKLEMSDHARLLVLSAEAACESGLTSISQFCRQQVINNNPGHLIGRFETVNDALADADFQFFLSKIRRRFTIEHAESELDKLEIDWQADLVKAGTVQQYLTELLGVDFNWIEEHFES